MNNLEKINEIIKYFEILKNREDLEQLRIQVEGYPFTHKTEKGYFEFSKVIGVRTTITIQEDSDFNITENDLGTFIDGDEQNNGNT